MKVKPNAVAMLSAMNEAQSHQMMAASLLAIAVCMKKAGLTEITVSPEDVSKVIEPGESLEPFFNVDGGMTYRFTKYEPPLAKKAVPASIKVPSVKPTRKKRK